MNYRQVFLFTLSAFFCGTAPVNVAYAATSSPPPMERTEHVWKGADRSSGFDALWSGAELKMIREEIALISGITEKNEYVFNAGALLHIKQDRYPAPGKSGETVATMMSFDKTGKPVISMKRIDGKPAGPASAAEIAQARKHLEELLAITGKVKR